MLSTRQIRRLHFSGIDRKTALRRLAVLRRRSWIKAVASSERGEFVWGLTEKAARHMGLTNIKVMIPFCRSPEEAKKVLGVMKKNGLVRGENGLEVYVMTELPANVLRAREFAEVFDGFSIGSNDLTQMVLGVDRDSTVISHLFDERDPSVMRMLSMAISSAKEAGKPIGICGQAPSDYPEISRMLVSEGISSISVTPDAVLNTIRVVLEAEAATKSLQR